MKNFSIARLGLALALGATLTACSSTPDDNLPPSDQQAPGSENRPVLSAREAENFVPARWFLSLNKEEAPWTPADITLQQQPDFVVGPANGEGVTHTTLQAAVDAAIVKRSSRRQYIAVMPGEYPGTVYIPAASNSVTIYGTGETADAVKIGLALDSEIDVNTWRRTVNPGGKYMPGKPSWYMFDTCQRQRSATVGIMCSAAVWSQNNGLQLQNLTIQNTLGDSVDAGDHHAVALRSDGDNVQINKVNLLGRQNTLFVTNSDIRNRMLDDRLTRTLVTNSYLEGDVDIVAGRGAVVFNNDTFRVVQTRTQREGYVFAPATPAALSFGFLAENSRFIAEGDGVAKLGRAWDLGVAEGSYSPGQSPNGQVVIRTSTISKNFNQKQPWGDALDSGRPYAGNIGNGTNDNNEPQRDLNDPAFNRLWEFHNSVQDSE